MSDRAITMCCMLLSAAVLGGFSLHTIIMDRKRKRETDPLVYGMAALSGWLIYCAATLPEMPHA